MTAPIAHVQLPSVHGLHCWACHVTDIPPPTRVTRDTQAITVNPIVTCTMGAAHVGETLAKVLTYRSEVALVTPAPRQAINVGTSAVTGADGPALCEAAADGTII